MLTMRLIKANNYYLFIYHAPQVHTIFNLEPFLFHIIKYFEGTTRNGSAKLHSIPGEPDGRFGGEYSSFVAAIRRNAR